MSREYTHSHAGHSHTPANFNKAFLVGIGLNAAYVLLEAIFGIIGHSLALVADAGHNLSDVLGLLLAWGASAMAKSLPTKTKTYGLRGTSILAALFNAIFLLVSVGAIAWEKPFDASIIQPKSPREQSSGFASRHRNQYCDCADVRVWP
jgi:cobalt-zinc-cadmium efflux system protein